MARKKRDPREVDKQLRWERYHNARFLSEAYPQLASLTIDMNFKDFDDGKNLQGQQYIYPPNSKAFFEFECPYRECISGGFDLSGVVSAIVTNKEIERTDTITCQGWQDRERRNVHKCFLDMTYTIRATYK